MVQAQITLANHKYAKLITDDLELTTKVSKLLSYREPGVEFTPAFQNHYWDGMYYLLNKKNEFPIGLVGTVKDFLITEGIEPCVKDARPDVEIAPPLEIIEHLKSLNKTPRYYQDNALQEAIKHRRGIIKLATGGGKSLIAALLAAKLNKPTTILVIGLDLLSQFHSLFSEIFDEEIGYIGNGVCKIGRINIVSLWTASRALGLKSKILDEEDENNEKFNSNNTKQILDVLKGSKLIIIDECHAANTASFKSLYKVIDPEYMYGLSGTPYRDDEADILIRGFLGEIIVNITASELIKNGFLIKPTIKFFSVPKQSLSSRNYHQIYKQYIIENSFRNKMIVNSTKKLVESNYQTLVLFRYINHGKKIFDMLKRAGIECEFLSGNDKLEKRDSVKEQLLTGKLRCVVSSVVYDIGTDIPTLNALVLAGGGKSNVRTIQRIGRVIRISPKTNKKDVKVVDFWDDALFLKNHSKKRMKIYLDEPGFEVIPPQGIKNEKRK